MAYILTGNTQDAYTDAQSNPVNTLTFGECWLLDIVIQFAAIAYQLQAAGDVGKTGQTGLWLPEAKLFLAPTSVVYASLPRRFTGIRVRSLLPGNPATFYCEAVPPNELPPEVPTDLPGRTGGTYSRLPDRIR